MDTRKGRRVIIYRQRCRDNVSIVTESLMVHWASTMNSTNQTCTMNMKINTLLFRRNPNKKDLYLYLTINLYVCFLSPILEIRPNIMSNTKSFQCTHYILNKAYIRIANERALQRFKICAGYSEAPWVPIYKWK